MKFCTSWRLKKKKKGIFELYQDFSSVQKNRRKKNGSSAMASTDNFLSFIRIKEHKCFLLKMHWSEYYWKWNVKASNLVHGIWLQERKQHQLFGNLHIFPLARRRLHTELCLQTNQPESDEPQKNKVSPLRRQRPWCITEIKPCSWKYQGSAAGVTQLRWKVVDLKMWVLGPVL